MLNQPTDAPAVMRDLIDRWASEGEPPEEVALENVNGDRTASTEEFLEHMAGPYMPADTRRQVEAITGRRIGTYGEAAAVLQRALTAAAADELEDSWATAPSSRPTRTATTCRPRSPTLRGRSASAASTRRRASGTRCSSSRAGS
jgi:hypothetical protein